MSTDRYPPPMFEEPIPDHFIYAGWSVDPPRLPRVRLSTARQEFITSLAARAVQWEQDPQIAGLRIYQTRLIAPVPGTPRLDVLLLGRARTAAAARVLADAVRAQQPQLLMHARNTHRFGDTDGPGTGTFLFNHFTAPDPATAVPAWERAAAWFVHEMDVDNTRLLQPDPEVAQAAPYPLVNYVQAPCGPAAFLRRQLTRPSFHTYVRRLLHEHQMTSLPLLAHQVRAPHAIPTSDPVPPEESQ